MGESYKQQPEIAKTPEQKEKEIKQIKLEIEPRVKEKWEDFLKHCGPNAIALDGRVIGPTKRDLNLPAANFNHHEEVDRTSTSSTSEQVLTEIRLGLFETFKKDDEPHAHVFVEDCDEDVSTAIALLEMYCENPELLNNKNLDRLVSIENHLDMTAGMYPMPQASKILAQVRWVYEPYRTARTAGEVEKMDAVEMEKIIRRIGKRIRRFANNRAEEIPLDSEYTVLGGGKNWKMVREIGNDARVKIVEDGIKAITSVTEVHPKNENKIKWKYTLARMSTWVKFPLNELYTYLNEKENIPAGSPDSWGGSDLAGGSPRQSHSSISPEQMEKLINEFLEKNIK